MWLIFQILDIELAHRLISAWNAVQFNFWRDYHLDVDLSTIVQVFCL